MLRFFSSASKDFTLIRFQLGEIAQRFKNPRQKTESITCEDQLSDLVQQMHLRGVL